MRIPHHPLATQRFGYILYLYSHPCSLALCNCLQSSSLLMTHTHINIFTLKWINHRLFSLVRLLNKHFAWCMCVYCVPATHITSAQRIYAIKSSSDFMSECFVIWFCSITSLYLPTVRKLWIWKRLRIKAIQFYLWFSFHNKHHTVTIIIFINFV